MAPHLSAVHRSAQLPPEPTAGTMTEDPCSLTRRSRNQEVDVTLRYSSRSCATRIYRGDQEFSCSAVQDFTRKGLTDLARDDWDSLSQELVLVLTQFTEESFSCSEPVLAIDGRVDEDRPIPGTGSNESPRAVFNRLRDSTCASQARDGPCTRTKSRSRNRRVPHGAPRNRLACRTAGSPACW